MATQLATLAGGCFWCFDAVFRRLRGVEKVVTGYCGGTTENPTMEEVYGGNTGHAESVQVTFDPTIISYEKLLEVFFHLHDPTTIQQPGTLDAGDEYRSVIFYHSDEQERIGKAAIKKIVTSKMYTGRIITELVKFEKFYPAKEGQQEYYEKNSYQPYCQIIIDPKLQKLFKEYRSDLKEAYQHS